MNELLQYNHLIDEWNTLSQECERLRSKDIAFAEPPFATPRVIVSVYISHFHTDHFFVDLCPS